ncbi:hypothetical protein Tco_1418173 [Tanacetum coccineum]
MYHRYMTSHGLIMEYGRKRNQSNILASLSTIKLGVRNGQPIVGERMVIAMEEIFPVLTILETRSITKTLNDHDEIEYKKETHDERHKLCETNELPVCNMRRFKMIKYSFGQDEEYVVVKEDEYDDLARTSKDACRAYQEIFRMMDEGWMFWQYAIFMHMIRRPRERNIDAYWWRIYKSKDLKVLES